jgi:transmembrane sensor
MKPTNKEWEAIEAKAAEWLARRDRLFTPEEAVAFARWRMADARHAAAVAELELVWGALDDLSASVSQQRAGDAAVASPAPIATTPAATGRSRTLVAWWPALGLAAALVVMAVWWGRSSTAKETPNVVRFETPIGAQSTVTLADGSEVQLNTNTAVSVHLGRRARAVTLERGEAFFRVARDEARPFVVAVGRTEARVLGTAFAVRLRAADSVVLVTEGVVQFGVIGKPGAQLRARQQATIKHRGSDVPRVETLVADVVARRLAWQNGQLEFDNTPLSEAVEEFNRYHRQQIVIADPAVATSTVGGRFAIGNSEGFVRLIEATFDATTMRRNQEEIVLGSRP